MSLRIPFFKVSVVPSCVHPFSFQRCQPPAVTFWPSRPRSANHHWSAKCPGESADLLETWRAAAYVGTYTIHGWYGGRKINATVGRWKDSTIDHVQNHGAKKRPFSGICWSIFCSQELFTKKIIWKPDPYPYHPCMVHLPAFGWFFW